LVNGFINHFNISLENTSNYSATSNIHNSQIITVPAKLFPACLVLTSFSLATASNSGDSSAPCAQVLSSQAPVQNWTWSQVKVTLRLTVSQSVSLGVEPHLGLMTRYLVLFDSYGLVSFCGAPSLTRGRVELELGLTFSLAYNISARTTYKTQLFNCWVLVCCCGKVFTEPLPRNGPGISTHLAGRCIATAIHAAVYRYEGLLKLPVFILFILALFNDNCNCSEYVWSNNTKIREDWSARKWSWPIVKLLFSICLDQIWKTMKTVSLYIRSTGRDFTQDNLSMNQDTRQWLSAHSGYENRMATISLYKTAIRHHFDPVQPQ
jgi:hypothetical protein